MKNEKLDVLHLFRSSSYNAKGGVESYTFNMPFLITHEAELTSCIIIMNLRMIFVVFVTENTLLESVCINNNRW